MAEMFFSGKFKTVKLDILRKRGIVGVFLLFVLSQLIGIQAECNDRQFQANQPTWPLSSINLMKKAPNGANVEINEQMKY